MTNKRRVTDADYRRLAEFRYAIRIFLEFSEQAARGAGITPQQHQALLTIRGLNPGEEAALGTLAQQLRIKHHSAVELTKRLAVRGLLRRRSDPTDRRRVLLSLTAKAERILASLSAAHLDELKRMHSALLDVVERPDRGL